MIDLCLREEPRTLSEYNNSLYTSDGILTGREFRRLRRKNRRK